MPRPKLLIPTRVQQVTLPEDIYMRLQLYLTSGLDGKVPFAAYQTFFVTRINEFFTTRALDISGLGGLPPGTHIVKALPETIHFLSTLLGPK